MVHRLIASDGTEPSQHDRSDGVLCGCRVHVNGEVVAREEDTKGMFMRHRIDITQQIAGAQDGLSSLELLILPPDHVGCVDKG